MKLPEEQFYNEMLAPPDYVAVRRKTDIIPHPLDLLVLNAMYGHSDLHCFEIAQRIYEITEARFDVSHKQVWLALRRLCKAGWIDKLKSSLDKGRRDSSLYRLRNGGGSHLRLENKRWREIAPLITRVAELK